MSTIQRPVAVPELSNLQEIEEGFPQDAARQERPSLDEPLKFTDSESVRSWTAGILSGCYQKRIDVTPNDLSTHSFYVETPLDDNATGYLNEALTQEGYTTYKCLVLNVAHYHQAHRKIQSALDQGLMNSRDSSCGSLEDFQTAQPPSSKYLIRIFEDRQNSADYAASDLY